MVMRHDMVKKPDKASEAGRAANQPAMQADRHHFRGGFPLLIQHIKRVSQVACKLITIVESLRRRKPHVIRIQRVGNDQMWLCHLGGPERQIIRVIIGVIEKATLLGDEITRVLAGSASIPAKRPRAADIGMDGDGAGHMFGLLIAAHAMVIDPAITVRGDLMTISKRTLNHRRMPLHRHGDGKQRDRQRARAKQIKNPPDAGA